MPAVEKNSLDLIDAALASLGATGCHGENGDDCVSLDSASIKALAKRLLPLVDRLDPRKKLVICKRYGIGGEDAVTLQAVGDELNRTRERVRQIQNAGLADLQKLLN